MLITFGLTVFVDLITAVGVGLIVAGFVSARWMKTEELKRVTPIALPEKGSGLSDAERQALKRFNGKIVLIMLRGQFSYASAHQLVQRLGNATAGHELVVFDFSEAAHIDTSAGLAIEELIEEVRENGQKCIVAGLSGSTLETLAALGVLGTVEPENLVADRPAAFVKAEALVAA